MTLESLLIDLKFETLVSGNPEITSIFKDAKKCEKGSLFICIQGISGDGHNYIDEAVKNGAVAVICDRQVEGLNLPAKLVENSRIATCFICKQFYNDPTKNMKLIGITGTKGKTSTSYFAEEIFFSAGYKIGVIGTTGVRINKETADLHFTTSSTPDTIELYQIFDAMRSMGVQVVAMEVTSHALALNKVDALSFECGIFTNLTRDHLDFHNTHENYLEAKQRLFPLCEKAILNIDDEFCFNFAEFSKTDVFYGINHNSNYCISYAVYRPNGSTFRIEKGSERAEINLFIAGSFSVYNACGAVAAAAELGLSLDEIKKGLEKVKLIPGRIMSVENELGFAVIVDYAHTPDSLEKVISAVRPFTKGRVITLFGCGGDRDRGKRPLMGEVSGNLSDYCIITSDNPRNEDPNFIINEILPGIDKTGCGYVVEPDRRLAIFKAVELATVDDTIILTGKGHEDYQEFENKRRITFDDSKVVLEAILARQEGAKA